MRTGISRRKLAVAIAASGAAKALAQVAPPQSTPQVAPEDLASAARRRIQATGALLAKYEVPMSTEPAFQFKA